MKTALLGVLIVPITASVLGATMAAPGSTAAAEDKIIVKDDFSRQNAKWKFVGGQWVRRNLEGAIVSGNHGPQRNPVQFPDPHCIPKSIPSEFPRIAVNGEGSGTR